MTGGSHQASKIVPLRPGNLSARPDEAPRLAPEQLAAADLTNVVPFARPRRDDGPETPPVAIDGRPAPVPAKDGRTVRALLFVLVSIVAHAAGLRLLDREPAPLASVGQQAITVELVLGDNRPTGTTEQGGTAQTAAVDQQSEPEPREVEEAAPAAQDTPQPQPQPQPAEPEPAVTATAPEPGPAPAEPKVTEPVPQPPAPNRPRRETSPVKPEPPRDTRRGRRAEHQREAALTPGSPDRSANGAGRGRSDADTNYRGLVAAHLARFKQFPADAKARGERGVATVTFRIDGSGRVTSVAVAHGTGFATLDHETESMVRRASPFPAPPDGRAASFTVPISFKIN